MASPTNTFLWGVASSAFQYEGGITNDMTEWEAQGGFRQNGCDPRYSRANSHWELWEDDYRRLHDLGVNAYRFSLEWSRIEPERGRFDGAALDRYERQVERLLEYGIEPILTLHHFTHPCWFHKQTPWHSPDSVHAFAGFVEAVVSRLGPLVRRYVTLNEPLPWAVAAYGDARFPPGTKDLGQMMKAVGRLLAAHREAYERIHSLRSDALVGIAHSCVHFAPSRAWHPLDRGLSSRIDTFFNDMLPRALHTGVLRMHFPTLVDYEEVQPAGNIDFWGVNYYYRLHVRFRLRRDRPFELLCDNRRGIGTTDMGWEIYPEGLEHSVRRMARHGKPVLITENGIATEDDELRQRFLREHLAVVEKLREGGVRLEGYLYWSLLDNYEWLVGEKARFGLYNVQYDNGFGRELRTSGDFYAGYIRRQIESSRA